MDVRTVITWLAAAVMMCGLLWEDRINGYFAGKRMLPEMKKTTVVFREEGYTSTTELGKSEWSYEKIDAIAEDSNYFVFLFGKNHAQVYDKGHLSGGSAEEFRSFIEMATGKSVQKI